MVSAPMPLMSCERRTLRRVLVSSVVASSRRQCLTIPTWDRVNEVKTPMMYSWISFSMLALKPMMSAAEIPARSRMPLLKASRSPLLCSCRGRNRSWARIDAKVGKPLNAVFAARIRMPAVAAWKAKNKMPCPHTASASWLMTEGFPVG